MSRHISNARITGGTGDLFMMWEADTAMQVQMPKFAKKLAQILFVYMKKKSLVPETGARTL